MSESSEENGTVPAHPAHRSSQAIVDVDIVLERLRDDRSRLKIVAIGSGAAAAISLLPLILFLPVALAGWSLSTLQGALQLACLVALWVGAFSAGTGFMSVLWMYKVSKWMETYGAIRPQQDDE